MRKPRLCAIFASLLLVAIAPGCLLESQSGGGGDATSTGAGSSTSTGAGGATSTGAGGATSTGAGGATSTGTGGAMSGSVGAGGTAPECVYVGDYISTGIDLPTGDHYGCVESPGGLLPNPKNQPSIDVDIEGVVVEHTESVVFERMVGAIVIDSCSPNADCEPELSTFLYAAPELEGFAIPLGAYVKLKLFVMNWVDCWGEFTLTNLPSWQGEANPVTTQPLLWFAGRQSFWIKDPGVITMPDSLYGIEALDAGCPAEQKMYEYRLFEPGAPSNSVIAPMGVTVELPLVSSTEVWRFRNVASGLPADLSYGEGHPYHFWIHQVTP